MSTFHPPQSRELIVIIPILLATLGYLAYWYISFSPIILKLINRKIGMLEDAAKKILFQRLIGILFLGIVPAFITIKFLPFSLQNLGVSFSFNFNTLLWIFCLSGIVILLSFFGRDSIENLKNYPQIRKPDWDIGLIILNIVSWAGFLLAYEFLFRGILLFTLVETLGIWTSIAINTSLYALVHFPKGPRETLGAIPLGIVLCIATLSTGTIWTAFFVHLLMALSNDYFSIRSHPNYRFVK